MLKTYIKSSRLIHWIPIFLNSIIATLISRGNLDSAIFIGLQISCIASFSFVFNDVLDAKIDELNWEKRMSELSSKKRYGLGVLSLSYLVIAFITSIIYTPNSLYAMIILAIALIGYNIAFKRILFLGNIIAAITIMSPIGIPYLLYGSSVNPFIIIILISGIVYNFSREIILDIVDVKGDSQNGRHTFPVIFGQKKSIALSITLYILACLILIFSPLIIKFEINILFQCLISVVFLTIFVLSFSKLKFLINISSEPVSLKTLQPFINYSRITIILFPIVLLIYYFAR